jgi:alcohol dehydrogenase class IV
MQPFEFSTASRIVFGPGTVGKAAKMIAELGETCLLVTGSDPSRAQGLRDQLERERIKCKTYSVTGEPSLAQIDQGVEAARDFENPVIVGFGGGSVVDSAKAIAGLFSNEGKIINYLEVIGGGKPLQSPGLPCVAIPTTAGTGAEVTKNCVLSSPEHRRKVSLRSPYLLPKIAIIDPDLTLNLPPAVTAASGLDAITQLIEPYVSIRANPFTDALCRDALPRSARSLERCFNQGDDRAAREDLALCSLFSGLALANAGLGAVHGLAGVLGGIYPAPHGAVCALLLPWVIRTNIEALEDREPNNPALARYSEVARLITGHRDANAIDAVEWTSGLVKRMGIKPLNAYGMTEADIPMIAEMSLNASSTKANPIVLNLQELISILQRAL